MSNIKKILEEAGDILMKFYQGEDLLVSNKNDNSPVTNADIESSNYIINELKKISDIPVVSEENYQEISERYSKFWILDPLDGTKEFIKRNGEFCICLGLVSDDHAIEGYIYSPVRKVLYSSSEIIENKPRLSKKYKVTLSRSHSEGEKDLLDSIIGAENYEIVYLGSAIKFCEMIDGKIDLYLRFAPCKEWDTAAGQAILEANGFKMIDINSKKIMSYNKDGYINNPFIAYSPDIEDIAKKILEAI
ncbi:MAG: 3'(2'),5'-bisphosphate nucleotidase CysQ [Alphaproteobacteria bacterium]|nr:3'(2'),5'-bisphosphate nucleotidase CysQ [Alphaproteobacteria bacterium]OJV16063.1 MAG: hypothetical protein BGO27_04370 [Alphaproteobacteria bacterium 33-17]